MLVRPQYLPYAQMPIQIIPTKEKKNYFIEFILEMTTIKSHTNGLKKACIHSMWFGLVYRSAEIMNARQALKIQIKAKKSTTKWVIFFINFLTTFSEYGGHTHTHTQNNVRALLPWLGLFKIKLRASLCHFSHVFFSPFSFIACKHCKTIEEENAAVE